MKPGLKSPDIICVERLVKYGSTHKKFRNNNKIRLDRSSNSLWLEGQSMDIRSSAVHDRRQGSFAPSYETSRIAAHEEGEHYACSDDYR